jgi:hypothetical protein
MALGGHCAGRFCFFKYRIYPTCLGGGYLIVVVFFFCVGGSSRTSLYCIDRQQPLASPHQQFFCKTCSRGLCCLFWNPKGSVVGYSSHIWCDWFRLAWFQFVLSSNLFVILDESHNLGSIRVQSLLDRLARNSCWFSIIGLSKLWVCGFIFVLANLFIFRYQNLRSVRVNLHTYSFFAIWFRTHIMFTELCNLCVVDCSCRQP